ncbi:MAG: hypothetical protein ABIS17_14685 [Casimicrobiaceae bacterium]
MNASSYFAAIAAACLATVITTPGAVAAKPIVVKLTQVPCQFLESEGGTNRAYQSQSIKDCEAINAQSGAERVAAAKVLKLKAGDYVFRVKNENVPYELGFWLRGAGVASRLRLPSVSGGGLTEGKTQDYAITLKAGEYLYSCPLNTTPDYKLVVTG